MASATTSEFVRTAARQDVEPFSLIEHKGLVARLGEELTRAASELARDPRGFIQDLLSSDTKDAKRRRRLQVGLACAVVAHVVLIALMVVAGWHRILDVPERERDLKVTMLGPSVFEKPADTPAAPKPEPARGSDGGGGGGGQLSPTPASKGVLPQMIPAPPIVAINPSTVPNPVLPIPATIAGPESAPPPPEAALGDPKGKAGEFSGGPGSGGGAGSGSGTGVGRGGGPGTGAGAGGSQGSGAAGSPEGGALKTSFNFNDAKPAGFAPFSWTYRPTPVVTPEAQANKVSGTVLLRATFRADGKITDIEIINPVSFMTESAVDALKRSKFRPATNNGVPVTLYRVPVRINVHH